MEYEDIQITKIDGVDNDKVKIRDENNVLYTIWKQKKDGETTKAYAFYETLHNQGLGLFVNIGFDTKESKGHTYYTIAVMHEPKSKTKQLAVEGEYKKHPVTEPINEPTYEPIDKPNWDRISWGKCKHAFLMKVFENTISINDIADPDGRSAIESCLKYAEPIAEQWANASMGMLEKPLLDKDGELPSERDKEKLPF